MLKESTLDTQNIVSTFSFYWQYSLNENSSCRNSIQQFLKKVPFLFQLRVNFFLTNGISCKSPWNDGKDWNIGTLFFTLWKFCVYDLRLVQIVKSGNQAGGICTTAVAKWQFTRPFWMLWPKSGCYTDFTINLLLFLIISGWIQRIT